MPLWFGSRHLMSLRMTLFCLTSRGYTAHLSSIDWVAIAASCPLAVKENLAAYFSFTSRCSHQFPFTSNILLLSSFTEESKEADLIEAKGTVILHLTHHAQYNPALVQDFLKHIRSSIWLTERLVTPFNLALAFSLTSVEKFQDKVSFDGFVHGIGSWWRPI